MTNPNLVNTSQVFMRSNVQIPISSITDILENPTASNMIIRVDVVTICNTTATAADIDVYLTWSGATEDLDQAVGGEGTTSISTASAMDQTTGYNVTLTHSATPSTPVYTATVWT